MVPHPRGRNCVYLSILAFTLTAVPVLGQARNDPAQDEVPYGAATNWVTGSRLLAEGDVKGALQHLHLAYRLEPDEPLVALAFQEALAAGGLLDDAIGVMDRLLAAHPDSTSWHLRRAALNLRAGRSREALADLRQAREQGELSIEALSTEARILAELGRTEQALDTYRDGIDRFPESGAGLFLGMADVLQSAGQAGEIPDLAAEAIARYPRDPGLRLMQSQALAVVGRDEEAFAAARQADAELTGESAEVGPTVDPATGDLVLDSAADWTTDLPPDGFQVSLADFYTRHGKIAQAIALLAPLAEAGDLGEGPSIWYARLLLGTGRLEEAAAAVDRISARWPESGRGWYVRGKLHEARSDWAGALPHFRRAAEAAPRDPDVQAALVRAMLVLWERDLRGSGDDAAEHRAELQRATVTASAVVTDTDTEGQIVLGYGFRALGDLDRAAFHFGLAAADPELRKTASIQQSLCFDESGEESRARSVLEDLHREYPQDADVANSLGYYLAEKGEDLDKAEKLIRQALAVEPANGAFLDSLGWVHFRRGRHDDALDYLIRAVNVLPEDPVILEHLGMVLEALGQHVEARNAFLRALEAGGDRQRLAAAAAAADSAAAAAER